MDAIDRKLKITKPKDLGQQSPSCRIGRIRKGPDLGVKHPTASTAAQTCPQGSFQFLEIWIHLDEISLNLQEYTFHLGIEFQLRKYFLNASIENRNETTKTETKIPSHEEAVTWREGLRPAL